MYVIKELSLHNFAISFMYYFPCPYGTPNMPNLSPPSHRGMQYHHFHDTLHRDVVTPGDQTADPVGDVEEMTAS